MSYGSLTCWILTLQEYNVNWEDVPGHKNTVGDVLSIVNLEENSCEVESREIFKMYYTLK